ncbi:MULTISPECIES: hypothetical protein [Rahnella]|jgi:hypothetical protein|uniref:hypothetical protein n=1 Tax=Rahnella TaxID=34037 RepID=UPI000564E859|nr:MULTISPECIES: hypothetical protein [Rahnella]QBJ06992.1 hypothetical protein EYS10_00100 [Rahnella aquatilis]MBU9839134.1 hypothetical protein [Rahnella aceris]MBU9848733.1 hypothetical protein [Rahnella aceris]MBU9863942.1 hypothetical protein [Rahnella aceris]MCM2444240.1 hypothetical protein [Rahnella sp. CG8]
MSITVHTAERRSLWQRITHRKVSHPPAERAQDTSRLLESFLATGCLYGIDVGNSDPAWFRRS